MRKAAHIKAIEADSTKMFSAEEFLLVMRSANFVGAFSFWRALEPLAQSDESTCFHARGVLRAMAESQFQDCGGVALSPQHAAAFLYCGLSPVGVRPPGSLAKEDGVMNR
jgi:hypothetical protein